MVSADESLDQILMLLDDIRERARSGAVVLVEGRRDAAALNELGVKRNVRVLKGGGTLLHALEGVRTHSEAIILTDFDRKGNELALFCAKQLKSLGVQPDLEIRRKLRALVGHELKDIEGLVNHIRRLEATRLPARSMRGTFGPSPDEPRSR
jgi:5S rRNA maturation endonuclease (ribonuclease M5)